MSRPHELTAPRAMVARAMVACAIAAALLSACGDPSGLGVGSGVDASIPSPLAAEPPEPLSDAGSPSDGGIVGIPADSSGRLLLPEAGAPPPRPLAEGTALPIESASSKDLAGVSLESAFRWRDVPPPPKAPEVAAEGIKEAARLTALTLRVDVTDGGRMRIQLTSRALPLPGGTELRARSDRWGHLLLWPNATEYRVIPAGALRTLLGERRVDVTPLAPGQAKAAGDGKRLGVTVRKVDVTAPLGTLHLELGKVSEAGDGGPLLCRAFVEMLGVDPKSSVCKEGEVALFASWAWQDGGGISWEATALTRRADFMASDFVVPPAGPRYAPSGLPIAPGGILLTRDEIAALRTGPIAQPSPPDPTAPGEGFVAVNQTDMVLYVLLDGVPVALVPPLGERYVIGTTRGRYLVQWRTFLGEKVLPASLVEMPARFTGGGAPDAGAPDAGR